MVPQGTGLKTPCQESQGAPARLGRRALQERREATVRGKAGGGHHIGRGARYIVSLQKSGERQGNSRQTKCSRKGAAMLRLYKKRGETRGFG